MPEPLKSYRQLKAWQLSFDPAKSVYVATGAMPADERFGLTAQMRRAAVSVPSNIAEGYGRGGRGEYVQHVGYAIGSLLEVETQLLLATEMDMMDGTRPLAQTEELARVLYGLKQSLTKTS